MKEKYNKTGLADRIGELLLENSLTMAIAESVTSGYLQNTFSRIPAAPDFFHGGITVNHLGEKTRLKNCLSENVAIRMARQITELFSCSVGVSIAGYQAPTSHSRFVYCALTMDGRVISTKKIRHRKGSSPGLQKAYGEQILKWILTSLRKV